MLLVRSISSENDSLRVFTIPLRSESALSVSQEPANRPDRNPTATPLRNGRLPCARYATTANLASVVGLPISKCSAADFGRNHRHLYVANALVQQLHNKIGLEMKSRCCGNANARHWSVGGWLASCSSGGGGR